MSHAQQSIAFNTTNWTKVQASCGSSPEARIAMNQLCEVYYGPVAMFIREARRHANDCEDLTQEFFARLLSCNPWTQVDRHQGRFRSYLLGAVKHFLSEADAKRLAKKRGGERVHLSLEASTEEGEKSQTEISSVMDTARFPPDAYFDRAWAVQLLDRVLLKLELEHEQSGTQHQFQLLRNSLTGQSLPADVAAKLGVADNSIKVLVYRLRRRFRELVKGEVLVTVDNSADVQQEINYLIEALSYTFANLG